MLKSVSDNREAKKWTLFNKVYSILKMMKKLFYFMFLSLLLVSCGDSDSSATASNDFGESSSAQEDSLDESSSSKTEISSSNSLASKSSSSGKDASSSSLTNKSSSSEKEASSSSSGSLSSSSTNNSSSSEGDYSSSANNSSSSAGELSSSSEKDLSDVSDEENTEGLVCDEEGKIARGVIDSSRVYYCVSNTDWSKWYNLGEDFFFIPVEAYVNKDFSYGTMTDPRDGRTYRTTKIGKQVWMAENLNFSTFTNGETNAVLETNLKSQTSCNKSDSDCEKSGRLYSWTAAMNLDYKYRDGRVPEGEIWLEHQGVCPEGWHIPTNSDWSELRNFISTQEGEDNVASSLQSIYGWGSGRLDKYGFTAFPVSRYYYEDEALFWSVDEYSTKQYEDRANYAYTMRLRNDSYGFETFSKTEKKSVRCLQNRGNIESIKNDATGLLSHTFERDQIFSSSVQYGSFKDERDGTVYKTVVIGSQEWFAENLNYKAITGSHCYDNNLANCDVYGRLYDRKTAKARQSELYSDVCPIGWHIPSSDEWKTLTDYVAAHTETPVGTALKSAVGFSCNDSKCETPSPTGTNEFGFSAIGAGWLILATSSNEGVVALFWMSDQKLTGKELLYRTETLDDDNFNRTLSYSLSVRCLKD